MALDRDKSFQIDHKTITTTRVPWNIPDDTYVLIHNTHATAIITAYGALGDADGIPVGPGQKRALPKLHARSDLWVVSDTADTEVYVWRSATKWPMEYGLDGELTVDAQQVITGKSKSIPGDPAQTASATITLNGVAQIARNFTWFTFTVDQDCDVTIRLGSDTATDDFILYAGQRYTAPFMKEGYAEITITDRSGVAWALDFNGW